MMKHVYLMMAMMVCMCTTVHADNWMKYLPNHAYVVDLSIPGAHDSATGNGWTGLAGTLTGPTYGTTQDLTFAKQWAAGVRAFDLRPKVNGSRLAINHGVLQTKLYFDDALRQLRDSLVANPTEFAVIHMLYADGYDNDKEKYKTMLLSLLNSDDLKDYMVDFRPDLTVGEMRGKILILSRDKYDDTPIGGFFTNWCGYVDWNAQTAGRILGPTSSSPLYMQDFSSTYGAEYRKANAIRTMLDFSTHNVANTASDIVWVFNFASAYNNNGTSTSNGYRSNAVNTHATILDYLSTHSAGPTGVILMDYAGVDKSGSYTTRGLELVEALIENNWRYLPKVSDDKMISVPFNAYKTTGWVSTTGDTFQVNSWSEEGLTDGSGMVTPFYEDWTKKSGHLGDGEIYYTLSDATPGYYKVSIRTRILNEASATTIYGASLFANESAIQITNGQLCTNGVWSNYSVIGMVGESGELKFGFKIADATFNWIAFTDVDVEYLGEAVTAEVGGELLNPVCEKTLRAAYMAAQAEFEANPTMETYNAMSEAYREAEPSIAVYKILANALKDADDAYEKASSTATEERITEFLNTINPIKDNYNGGEYADSEIQERIVPQVYAAIAALLRTVDAYVNMTSLIVNHSFETGDLTGWNLPNGTSDDTGVREPFDPYVTEGTDGNYLFNTWWKGVPVTQTIVGLPNGRYRLEALVASDGATVYLTANGGHNDGTETGGDYPSKETFQEASYEFDVTDGTATIGAVGSADGAAGVHKPYRADGYWWYKADNFRLTYLDSYLSSIAKPFIGDGEIVAGEWYAYQVTAEGDYDFSTIEGIEATTIDALMSEISSSPLEATTIALAAGTLYFISDSSQPLTITLNVPPVVTEEIEIEFTAEYGTMILPFDASVPDGMEVYSVQSATENGVLNLMLESTIAANTPYIIKKVGEDSKYVFEGEPVNTDDAYANGWLIGVFSDDVTAPSGSYVLQTRDEVTGFYIVEDDEEAMVKKYAAYLTPSTGDATDILVYVFDADDLPNAIDSIPAQGGVADIYSINGVLIRKGATTLNGLPKGVYIVSGQKVVIR